MKLTITPGFLLFIAILLFFDNNGILIWLGLTMVIHEGAHAAAALLLKGRLTACKLSLWGGCLTTERLSYTGELLSVIAGPLASLVTALAASYLGSPLFAGVNLVTGLYNLLPAKCLDGGRILELLLSEHPLAAYHLLRITTLLSAAALAVPLLLAFNRGVHNWSLLLSVLFLGLSAFWEL